MNRLLQYNITFNQFANLLVYNILMSESNGNYAEDIILTKSPSYLIEKYEQFVGNITEIKDDDKWSYSGIHPILREKILNKYFLLWLGENWERIFKIDSLKIK